MHKQQNAKRTFAGSPKTERALMARCRMAENKCFGSALHRLCDQSDVLKHQHIHSEILQESGRAQRCYCECSCPRICQSVHMDIHDIHVRVPSMAFWNTGAKVVFFFFFSLSSLSFNRLPYNGTDKNIRE